MIGMGGKAFQESRSLSTENEGQKERLQSAIACSGAVPMKGQEQGYRGKKSGIARVSRLKCQDELRREGQVKKN